MMPARPMIGLALAMWLVAAIEDQQVLVLVPEGASAQVSALNKRLTIELGLLLDGYALRRETVPAGFTEMPTSERIAYARERLEGRATAGIFLALSGEDIEVTVVVRDGDRALSRTAHGSNDGLESLALGVRELIASSYSWESEPRAVIEPPPSVEPDAPPPPVEPLAVDEHALYIDGGIFRSHTALSGAAGVQHAFANRLELRELVEVRAGSESARDTRDDVKRLGVALRVDAGLRFGNGRVRFVPMASARVGWLRTSVAPEPAEQSALATLGGAAEARLRFSRRAELVLRPEASWNIAPLRLRRLLTGATVSDDGAFMWGVRLGVAVYF